MGSLELWLEFEQTAHGRRRKPSSRSAAETIGLRVKGPYDTPSGEMGSEHDDDLMVITKDGWTRVCQVPHRIPELVHIAETSGLRGLRATLDAWGIEYRIPDGSSDR
jgi:hypothetical protein